MIKSKKQSFIIIGVFALVLMLGTVTYAFFNYTRTGTANTIRTGRISFNTSQSNTLNLTNVFPMSTTDAGNANLDAVSVRIWGDTTYSGGEEFEISIVDVNNTIGSGASAKTIPINYIASYAATPVQSGDPNVIGTNSDSYFTARGQSSPVYQLTATGEATNGEQVLIGYIPSGATGIDGTLTIKAYLDSSKIAISDTYNDGNTPTDDKGTPASFGEGKTVLTTTEWNALQNTQTPLSFKIKAVSQEGTWVDDLTVHTAAEYLLANVQTLETTPYGKIYTGADPNNYVIFNNEQWRIIGVYTDEVNGDMLKIVKQGQPLSSLFDDDSNVWAGSNLSMMLNGTYYDNLSSESKQMIYEGTWNVGACSYDSVAADAYTCSTSTTWNGKVGIFATYEYLYAAENSCRATSGYDFDSGCCDIDWLSLGLSSVNNGTWFINPSSSSIDYVLSYQQGFIGDGHYYSAIYDVNPVVYLKPGITITGGTGESGGNEYTLGYAAG